MPRATSPRLGPRPALPAPILAALVPLLLPTIGLGNALGPAPRPGAAQEAKPDPAGAPEARPGDAPADPGVERSGFDDAGAEQVARLERAIRTNREELAKQRARLDDGPDSPYRRAEGEFNALDARLSELDAALKRAEADGEEGPAEAIRADRDEVRRRLALAKERLELEIRERKAANEQVEILTQTIAADERQLQGLLGESPAPGPSEAPPAPAPAPDPPPASAPATAPAPAPATAPAPAPAPATAPAPAPAAAEPAPADPLGGLLSPALPSAATAPAAAPEKPRQEVVLAEREVEAKADAAERAEGRSRSLDERLGLVDRNIASMREQLRNAQLKSDNARQTRDLVAEEFRKASFDRAPQEALIPIRDRLREAEEAVRQANAEVRDRTARLEQLNDERALIADAREVVAREAEAARMELESARAQLREAVNPFSPRNLSRWFLTRGPGLLMILLISALLIWLINRFGGRVAALIAQRGTRGSQAEREDRARTIVSVFENAATAFIVVGSALMALDYAGVPIAPLLGGAAVLGLAISFGAQNLVSDFFYGFVILLENQYKLNDVVKINDHSGQVERITLRMTALRDLEGNLHFIPNGQITSVVNMTHGWSRALFDLGVAYKEDVDRVMGVVLELGKELRQDPRFRHLILEDPTMLGVDSFAESAVIIKFFIKTRPLQQWAVKRELLRRIKIRFDALGIEIPFPQRTVHHRNGDADLGHLALEAGVGDGQGEGHPAGPPRG